MSKLELYQIVSGLTYFNRMCVGSTHDTNCNFEASMDENLFDANIMTPFASYLKKAFRENQFSSCMECHLNISLAPGIETEMTLYGAPEETTPSNAQQNESDPSPGVPITFDVVQCSDVITKAIPVDSAKKSKKSRRVSQRSRRETESDSSSDESLDLPSSDGSSTDEDTSAGSAPAPHCGSGIPKTAYELQREERLKQNNELLKELGLDGNSVNALLPTKKNQARSNRQGKDGPAGPTRRSSRISSSGTTNHTITTDATGDASHVSSAVANQPDDSPLHPSTALSTATPPLIDLSQDEDTASLNTTGDRKDEQPYPTPKGGKKHSSSTIRQAGVEILVPLGVRSTDHEEFLEERQRMLEETDLTTSRPLTLLPPGGLDGDLFPVFDIQDIKTPELQSQAEWISEAELLLCDTFKSSGTFAKLAVQYWLKIEEKLGYPGSVSLSSAH